MAITAPIKYSYALPQAKTHETEKSHISLTNLTNTIVSEFKNRLQNIRLQRLSELNIKLPSVRAFGISAIIAALVFALVISTAVFKNVLTEQNAELSVLKTEITELKTEIETANQKQTDYEAFVADYIENNENDFEYLKSSIEENKLPENVSYIDEENLLTVIRLVCNWRDFPYELAYAVAIEETAMNPDSVGQNPDGSYDYGMYAFNEITLKHYGITPEIAMNPYMSTEYFILIMNNLIEACDGDLHTALRSYNFGLYGASLNPNNGKRYADTIIRMIDGIV
jgi:cell division protein FtsB